MHLERFTFRDIYLDADGETFDLHNCFAFVGFTHDVSTRVLSLHWNPNEYAPKDEHRSILVEFHGLAHLSIEPRDPAVPFTEDDCLSFVACAPSGSPVGTALACDQTTADMHVVFCFMSQMRLRVFAESAHLSFTAKHTPQGQGPFQTDKKPPVLG